MIINMQQVYMDNFTINPTILRAEWVHDAIRDPGQEPRPHLPQAYLWADSNTLENSSHALDQPL